MLALDGVTSDTQVDGVGRFPNGELNGELREPPAMTLCRTGYRAIQLANVTEQALRNFAASARNAGITTCTDLAGGLIIAPRSKAMWQRVTAEDDFPLRVAMYNIAAMLNADFNDAAQKVLELRSEQTNKLCFPGVKFILDGSIQGFTAMIKEPGYITGEDHGQLLTVTSSPIICGTGATSTTSLPLVPNARMRLNPAQALHASGFLLRCTQMRASHHSASYTPCGAP